MRHSPRTGLVSAMIWAIAAPAMGAERAPRPATSLAIVLANGPMMGSGGGGGGGGYHGNGGGFGGAGALTTGIAVGALLGGLASQPASPAYQSPPTYYPPPQDYAPPQYAAPPPQYAPPSPPAPVYSAAPPPVADTAVPDAPSAPPFLTSPLRGCGDRDGGLLVGDDLGARTESWSG